MCIIQDLNLMQIDGANHACVCLIGWQGLDCSECRPYWKCPNQNPSSFDVEGNPRIPACVQPNQCFCDEATAVSDTTGYCNLPDLNGAKPFPTFVNQSINEVS